ncbi:MAG: hypothetical protein R3C49_15230 [Planctomycetaceae bacterium]
MRRLISQFGTRPSLVPVVLCAVVAVIWSVFGGTLVTRPFWMDEIHSWLLISDPDSSHALQALSHGADYNPPAYYWAARSLGIAGQVTEFRLRLFSLMWSALSVAGIGVLLRRRYSSVVSMTVACTIAAHPLFVLQSTEARFYAMWLCLLIWYVILLTTEGSHSGNQQSSMRPVFLFGAGILNAVICTTHYFGIISVGLVTGGWMLSRWRRGRPLLPGIVLSVIAVSSVAACLPFLRGQRAALTCSTWILPPTVSRSLDFLLQFVPAVPGLLYTLAGLGGWMSARSQRLAGAHAVAASGSIPSKPAGLQPAVSPDWMLSSLLLMPPVLVVFSWTVQPALVDRYAIVAIAGLVPVYAWLLGQTAPTVQKAALVCSLVGLAVSGPARRCHVGFHLQKADLQKVLNQLPADQPVIFEDRIAYWLLQHADPHPHRYQADHDHHSWISHQTCAQSKRDVGRTVHHWYPSDFRLLNISEDNIRPTGDHAESETRVHQTITVVPSGRGAGTSAVSEFVAADFRTRLLIPELTEQQRPI